LKNEIINIKDYIYITQFEVLGGKNMGKKKVIGVTIILVLAIFATYWFVIKGPDTDGDGVTDEEERMLGTDPYDPDDAKKGILIYDSSGKNYESGTRGETEPETYKAYIVTPKQSGYETTEVFMDESIVTQPYLALSGIFKIDESGGTRTVSKFIETEEAEVDL